MALACSLAKAQDANSPAQYKTADNILYREGKLTEYMQERCRLDVYHPVGKEGYPTIVWFHGGGLKAGNRSVPEALKNK
ncbi:MAG: alpha/beta hydrolase, partial [Verrucomicrobia bacterium]|nr:alpha/beta hydrolase [Verrucomicrobiota bacterium]